MDNRNKPLRKRSRISNQARLAQSAIRKLEAVPRYTRNPYTVLTLEEHEASAALLRAVIAHVWAMRSERTQGRYKPRLFHWQGGRFRLAYSDGTLGRVFIVSPQGRNVIASGYEAI